MSIGNNPVFNIKQIRECERLAAVQFKITPRMLMDGAGKAVFDVILQRYARAKKIAIFCGGGNNGGDGYVVARLLYERGLKVTIWQVGNQDKLSAEAKASLDVCKKNRILINSFHNQDIQHSDLILDALCGIGATQKLRDDMLAVIAKINASKIPVIAIDIPSGIHADTGEVLGNAIYANATVTLIGLKMGVLTGSGKAHAGDVIYSDLQLPKELFSQIKPSAERIRMRTYHHYLKARFNDWHKGLSGHVLVIGGDLGFSGAVRMAAEAALRIGCGLVTVATRPENAVILNVNCPEIMAHGVTEAAQLETLLSRATVIVLGPGLGQSAWSKSLWDVVSDALLPILLDADGLNLLSQNKKKKENWILTPHPGEAARLLNKTVAEVQANRLQAACAIQNEYGGICVLKGAGSLIVTKDKLPAVCDKGNPGMATAGMGDILSGIIGGLMAQNIPLDDAAKLGVYLHAHAGDLAAKEGERGMLATDLLPYLRRLVNDNR